MKYCPHCNQPVTTKGRICPECGRPLKGKDPVPLPKTQSGEPKKRSCAAALLLLIIPIFIFAVIIIATVALNTLRLKKHTGQNNQSEPKVVFTVPLSPDSAADSVESEDQSTVTLRGYTLSKNLFEENVLLVVLDYYNGDSVNNRFLSKYRIQVFQDGVSCMETVAVSDSSMNITAELQPGATAEVQAAFLINPDKDVQLVVTGVRDKKTILDTTFSPQETVS